MSLDAITYEIFFFYIAYVLSKFKKAFMIELVNHETEIIAFGFLFNLDS